MTETELVGEIKLRAQDLKRRTTMWQYFFEHNTPEDMRAMLEIDAQRRPEGRATALPDPEMPPPATAEAVNSAEAAIGFPFPPLLRRFWIEVANGGFGPGYGLFGIEGGFFEDSSGLTIVELYREDVHPRLWPKKLVRLCDWGGDNFSAIDCATPEGEVVDQPETDNYPRRRKGMTFSEWMEAWIGGVDLWR